MPKTKAKTKIDCTYAVGKRRSATARIRLFRGKGETLINNKPAEAYFPGMVNKDTWTKPFKVVDVMDKYFATVKVRGGGLQGQIDAVVQGIAKALAKTDRENYRHLLKRAGLLTRDSRIRERRKVGMGGKARRQKQSPKR